MHTDKKELDPGFWPLVLRAAVVIAAVLAILVGLRLGGITVTEQDVPVDAVEAYTESVGPSLPLF